MRLGIDATWARIAGSGTASYTDGLVRALAPLLDTDLMLYFQAGDESENPLFGLDGPNIHRQVVDGWKQPGRTLWSLSRACARDRLDLFHSPGYFLPLWPGPRVVTFHDANMFAEWDKWWETGQRLSWLSLCSQTVLSSRLAKRIVTDSRTAGADISRLLRLPPSRISTVYPGIDDMYFAPPNLDAADRIRAQHGLDTYLLFVGVFSPIKNIPGILRAFALIKQPGLRLALVGRAYGSHLEEVVRPLIHELGLDDEVRIVGAVPREALPGLYAEARALVYPSFGEGFGLPPVEAMACGIPVVSSTRSCLPEVVGDAGILVDPEDINGLAAAMQAVLHDEEVRTRLIQRGLARSRTFRWSEAAVRIREVYASILGQ